MTFTFRPYRIGPFFGFSRPLYIESNNEVIIKAFFKTPAVVRMILTSPLVDIILYRVSPNGGRSQVISNQQTVSDLFFCQVL